MARRRIRLSAIKVAVQHAETNIANAGNAAAPATFNVLETETGARTVTGAEQTTKDSSTTGEVCNIGDIVKYINLFIQAGPRPDVDAVVDRTGWMEWALLMVKESDTTVPTTSTGTLTLGNICTNMFRNECIFTGCMPVGNTQPNYLAINIKVPKFKQKIRIGDEWRFMSMFRSVLSTSTSVATVRVIKSCMYKAYS